MNNTQEYIICSAIHYPNHTTQSVHKPKNIQSGLVLCGRRHHNIIIIYHELTGLKTGEGTIQGFLTSKDRFVTREEAVPIALAANQIPFNRDVLDKKQLYSEDIY